MDQRTRVEDAKQWEQSIDGLFLRFYAFCEQEASKTKMSSGFERGEKVAANRSHSLEGMSENAHRSAETGDERKGIVVFVMIVIKDERRRRGTFLWGFWVVTNKKKPHFGCKENESECCC